MKFYYYQTMEGIFSFTVYNLEKVILKTEYTVGYAMISQTSSKEEDSIAYNIKGQISRKLNIPIEDIELEYKHPLELAKDQLQSLENSLKDYK